MSALVASRPDKLHLLLLLRLSDIEPGTSLHAMQRKKGPIENQLVIVKYGTESGWERGIPVLIKKKVREGPSSISVN